LALPRPCGTTTSYSRRRGLPAGSLRITTRSSDPTDLSPLARRSAWRAGSVKPTPTGKSSAVLETALREERFLRRGCNGPEEVLQLLERCPGRTPAGQRGHRQHPMPPPFARTMRLSRSPRFSARQSAVRFATRFTSSAVLAEDDGVLLLERPARRCLPRGAEAFVPARPAALPVPRWPQWRTRGIVIVTLFALGRASPGRIVAELALSSSPSPSLETAVHLRTGGPRRGSRG